MRHQGSYPRRLSTLSTTKVTSMPPLCVEQALETRTVQCVNTGHILKRMKGLKKLKRKMGLAPRWGESNTIPSTPLFFHDVYGDNLRTTHGGRGIRRTLSFCKGIAFSSRPIKINERVCIRLQEISSNWSGVLRFGFTNTNPESLRDCLPKYVCPDLTSRPGYWAKALSERYGKQGSVLHFSYNTAGDIIYGIDQVDLGLFLRGIEVHRPLWVVIDVYGNSTALQFLELNTTLNNRPNAVEQPAATTHIRKNNHAMSNRNTPAQPRRPYRSSSQPDDVVTIPGFGNLSISDPSVIRAIEQQSSTNAIPLVIYQNVVFNPMSFHSSKGENITFTDHNRTIAHRNIHEYSKGYVFSGRTLAVNEKLVVQVLAIEPHYVGAMSFGVTSADPSNLRSWDLPEDCDELLDRSEYWVVCKDVAAAPKAGDELAFTFSPNGQITFAKNNGSPHVIMHVDSSLQLYAFFDLFGHTSKIRILGTVQVQNPNRSMEEPHRELHNRLTNGPTTRTPSVNTNPITTPTQRDEPVVMTDYRPPNRSPRVQSSNSPLGSTCEVSPFNHSVTPQLNKSTINGSPVLSSSSSTVNNTINQETSECSVCYEKQIDSVLYSCGHMCMCYGCALQQWKGRGGGMCPICRAVIKDVIRTYKS